MSGAALHERRVLVAVPTYRRTGLLPHLVTRIREEAARIDLPWRILLVDNDPDLSAASTARELGVEHVAEPTPGIAAARQAALDAAAPGELVVMIDDDLEPEHGWLAGLVDAWTAHRPAVVMGYVRYVWPEGTDPWIAAGGFMRRSLIPTGERLPGLKTGNVLIDADRVRELDVRFDVSLGLSGGSDVQFGRDLIAAGGTIVASAESVARDDIAPERTTLAFVRRRAICQGQVRARLYTRAETPGSRMAKRAGFLVGGLIRMPAFAAGEALARLRGDVGASATYRRRLWFARGRVMGALGLDDFEYARPAASA
ncbi:glycosyltransferase [Agrococcus sp. HG114]|uniref:glycosyltransferase n=1 Tax=Agrococcus sp. HG114 TaxID=2969757 RepID=UPI00215B4B1E|nr:glycosyltransferase [Agrococcus sp. HG114]MCR8670987.1 glycosyltransferase [Agrococcus sp. HG114]